MENNKKISSRPWWMINGAREPIGDVFQDYLVAERLRWSAVPVEDEDDERETTSLFDRS